MKTLTWHGCYDLSWKGFITPASFGHPAKMSRGLLERIIAHGFEKGYWQEGSTIGDCFGGVGTTGIIGAYHGLRVVSVELEPRFVSMARRNYALHSSKWKALGSPRPVILQGDSRSFRVLVGKADAMVSSPPYAETAVEKSSKGVDLRKNFQTYKAAGGGSDFEGYKAIQEKHSQGYGKSNGQIAALKEGSVDSVVASPPYADSVNRESNGIDWTKAERPERWGNAETRNGCQAAAQHSMKYAENTSGQIGALKSGEVSAVVTSPPWENNSEGGVRGSKFKNYLPTQGKGHGSTQEARSAQLQRDEQKVYGDSPGQIGKLKGGSLDGVCTSPPYAANEKSDYLMTADGKTRERDLKRGFKQGHGSFRGSESYGDSEGQIGRLRDNQSDYLIGETSVGPENYWMAMSKVYKSCYQAIRPGGILCLVVKDYVKAGKRVPLCDDTVRLIEHIGFQMVERVHAMLVKETVHADLFGADTKQTTSRKSFFRRLAEKKGSPAIDYEEVLFARKPL